MRGEKKSDRGDAAWLNIDPIRLDDKANRKIGLIKTRIHVECSQRIRQNSVHGY